MIRAIILAAGKGSRLYSDGSGSKPLTEVGNSPMLFRILDTLERADVEEAVVVTGFRHEYIEKKLEDYCGGIRVRTVYNENWEKSNGLSVLAAKDFVKGPTVLTMSDHLYPVELIRQVLAVPVPVDTTVLAVDRDIENVFDIDDATKVLLQDERVVRIDKALTEYNAVDTGVFRITPNLIDALEEIRDRQGGDASLSDGIRRLASEKKVRGLDITGCRWVDVDDPRALKYAELLIKCIKDEEDLEQSSSSGSIQGSNRYSGIPEDSCSLSSIGGNNSFSHGHAPEDDPMLMNPGPVWVSSRVQSALGSRRMCHRDPEFSLVLESVQSRLRKVMGASAEHDVLLTASSGTGAVESMITTFHTENKTMLVLSNGAFGERIAEISLAHNLNVIHIEMQWGADIEEFGLDEYLDDHPEVDLVAVVHHETSIGALNPLTEIGRTCRQRNLLFLVDAVASLGAEVIDVERDFIDVCASSSNKCIHAPSGVGIVCVGPRAWKSITDHTSTKSFYFDLRRYRKASRKAAQTPFTPAVQNMLALNEALAELLEQGVSQRRKQYECLTGLARIRLEELGLEQWEMDSPKASGLSIFRIPPFLSFQTLYEEVKERGFIIYQCKGELSGRYFQLATMGDMTVQHIENLAGVLAEVMEMYRPRVAAVTQSATY